PAQLRVALGAAGPELPGSSRSRGCRDRDGHSLAFFVRPRGLGHGVDPGTWHSSFPRAMCARARPICGVTGRGERTADRSGFASCQLTPRRAPPLALELRDLLMLPATTEC